MSLSKVDQAMYLGFVWAVGCLVIGTSTPSWVAAGVGGFVWSIPILWVKDKYLNEEEK